MSETPNAEPNPSSPKSAPSAPPEGAKRPLLRRLVSAQESGLLIVILLMMVGLTVFGGNKNKNFSIALAEDATVSVSPEGERFVAEVTEADGTVRTFESESRPRESRVGGSRVLFISKTVNAFLEPANLVLVVRDASYIAIMAVGMTGVIILAGIDLSVGSIYGLSAIVGAMVLNSLDPATSALIAVPVGILVCCAVGGLCGAANGAMTVGFRVHPFVITLGTMAALRGLAFILPKHFTGQQSIGQFPDSYTGGFFKADVTLPTGKLTETIQPVPILFMLAIGVLGWFALSKMVIGRRVYAIGGNETAAKYAGIPVGRVKFIVYTVAGLLAGLSAAAAIGYYGSATTTFGDAYELKVIAATVIGGASLMGGRGTAIGAVLGAIIIELINNGMIILSIDQDYTRVVMGGAIIVAVVVDQAKTRFMRS